MKLRNQNPECQVPLCKKESIKEVHLITVTSITTLFLCDEHFKEMEKYWKKVNLQREIYDLTPPEQKEVVQFT